MNAGSRILLFAFIMLIAAPSAIWFFAGADLQKESREKREMKLFPVLNVLTVKEFPSEFDKYYSDSLPFRNQIIDICSSCEYRFYGFTESEKVLFGKDGWLFYKWKQDGDPIADYKRINQFSQKELETIKHNLICTKNYLASHNSDFLLLICPNKENAYPEYMPDYIIRADRISRTKQLTEYMKGSGVRIISLQEPLDERKKTWPVYLEKDTHWNLAGAYTGSEQTAEAFGKKLPSFESLNPHTESGFVPKEYKDLLDIGGIDLTENRHVSIQYDSISERNDISEFETGFRNNQGSGRLMMLRDSFGIPMMPFLADQFSEARFIHRRHFKNSVMQEFKPDCLVLQIVERYLTDLLFYDIINDKTEP